ncbi:hypothetical protein KQX54_012753 [Cotesia glomerata]|uniref:Uncharacterized protein n=1 Tax=Cotesia glomerata TaxID=32391 RepID=A0AAV7IMR5_COTGL|nr:hypothetical protein KQX54_012753 [Cotesia glomerata]
MATRKITLYDSEREIVVEAIVSEAEAARAERASASVEVDQESSELYDEETSESFIGEERLDSDNPTDLNSETPEFEGETSVYRWNSPCVLLLLELYRSMEGTLNSGKISQKQIMDEIFGEKVWCNPVAVASSTGLSLKEAENNDSTAGSDSGCSLKTSKASIASLLGKRLHQKEEHEENKKKRHRANENG